MLPQIRQTVRLIPKGKVSTYGAVARAAGFPGRARQVVWALRNAAAGLPWHRVIGAGGRILLPGESGLDQRLRLRQDGVALIGDRVDLARHEYHFDASRPPGRGAEPSADPASKPGARAPRKPAAKPRRAPEA